MRNTEKVVFQNQDHAKVNEQEMKVDKEAYGAFSTTLHSPQKKS